MVVSSLIHSVEQFLLTGVISLAIVFATIRAYFAKTLVTMNAAGFSSFFIFSLLGTLSIYVCIAIIRCRSLCQRQVSANEECGITDEDIPNSRFKTPIFLHWRWDDRWLRFYKRREGAIKLVYDPSGKSLFF